MDATGHTWFEALRKHIQGLRAHSPIPARESLSPPAERQCQIIGGALIAWLEHHGPELLSEREIFTHLTKVESDPYVLIITDRPGLIAASQIVGVAHPSIESLLVEEYRALDSFLTDFDLKWHVEYHTYFEEEIDLGDRNVPKGHRLRPGEQYWIHTVETIMGPQMGVGAGHLWKWDGSEATLLKEMFDQRVY